MPKPAWEHAPEARVALHAIVADPSHGVAALSNPAQGSVSWVVHGGGPVTPP
jgi:hypothetical protein